MARNKIPYVLGEDHDSIMVWLLELSYPSGDDAFVGSARDPSDDFGSTIDTTTDAQRKFLRLSSFDKQLRVDKRSNGRTVTGKIYYPSGIRISLPGSSIERGRVSAELVLSNVQRGYVAFARAIKVKPDLKLSSIVVTRAQADMDTEPVAVLERQLYVNPIKMKIGQARYSERTMRLPLEIDARLNDVFQTVHFDPHHCPGLYK